MFFAGSRTAKWDDKGDSLQNIGETTIYKYLKDGIPGLGSVVNNHGWSLLSPEDRIVLDPFLTWMILTTC